MSSATSGVADAVSAAGVPTVEVHISDIHKRESFRHHSYLTAVCKKTIMGHGFEGYTFYCTPKSYVPCTPGDIFSAAVLITDQFGRQLICEAISGTYVLAEDGTLEWPPDDYHYNAPLSDWNFG